MPAPASASISIKADFLAAVRRRSTGIHGLGEAPPAARQIQQLESVRCLTGEVFAHPSFTATVYKSVDNLTKIALAHFAKLVDKCSAEHFSTNVKLSEMWS